MFGAEKHNFNTYASGSDSLAASGYLRWALMLRYNSGMSAAATDKSSNPPLDERLSAPVQYARGVGPDRARLLNRLSVRRAFDLLFFFPREYQDYSPKAAIRELAEGELATLEGAVEEIDLRGGSPGKSVLGVLFRREDGYFRAVWFNQPFMRERFERGKRYAISGAPKLQGLRWEFAHPRVEAAEEEGNEGQGDSGGGRPFAERKTTMERKLTILPVYPLTEGLNQPQMRRIVAGAVDDLADLAPEVLPTEFLDEHNLWPIKLAISQIHRPADRESAEKARERFVFQELLVQQLALAMRRAQSRAAGSATPFPVTTQIDARIRALFPFKLTKGQDEAIADIRNDLGQDFPMNRLLQGDVGSGKTVVAVYAALAVVAHGAQAALMAPTEVLARQHHETLTRLLVQGRVRITLLTGGLSPSRRQAALAQIATGDVDLVVGTHALASEDVQFANLGLVVIDEQHKFGVSQRARLKAAGKAPHYLVMTATPIPRTIGMTMFGDLDASYVRDAPPGRQPVHTYLVGEDKRERWWKFFTDKLREGRQGFVVAPLVEESEYFDVASLQAVYEELANGPLADFRLATIHGRMSGDEKAAVMQAFAAGQTQALVATPVIEVGVDVPNATMMTIEGGERFGVAQLHQLRGRVSRGKLAGYVGVFADPQTDQSKARLEAFVATTNGFDLAELDFELRGPGELIGARQHGGAALRIANLKEDSDTLRRAREAARKLIDQDVDLARPEYATLKRQVLGRYGKALDLGDVG